MKCIKDENQNVLVNEGAIKERWKEYLIKLFNNGGDTRVRLGYFSNSEENVNYTFYRRISSKEIRQALKKMKNHKAVGSDNIPIEAWKCMGEEGISWLTKLFNDGGDTTVRLRHLSNSKENVSYTFYRRISSREIR